MAWLPQEAWRSAQDTVAADDLGVVLVLGKHLLQRLQVTLLKEDLAGGFGSMGQTDWVLAAERRSRPLDDEQGPLWLAEWAARTCWTRQVFRLASLTAMTSHAPIASCA